MELYEFAYLDESKVRMLIAGIDKGHIAASKTTKAAKKNKEGTGGLRAGILSAGGSAASADEFTEEVSIEATPEGVFYRLKDSLVSGNDLFSDRIDNISIDELKRGQIVGIEGMIEISPANEIVSNLFQFIDAGAKLGILDSSDMKSRQSIQAIQAILDKNRLSVIVRSDDNKKKALAVLETKSLKLPEIELNDEFVIMGKITRIIKEGEVLDLTPYCMNPAFQKNKMIIKIISEGLPKLQESIGESVDLSDLTLNGPAVVLSPIAIYR
jgi:hypothetical protein